MLRLITGRAGAGKTALIYGEIAERVRAGQKNLILLLPEQYTHEAERELCAAAGDRLSLCGEVLSFTGLARRVFSLCGIRRQMMDGGGRVLCMAVAMHEVSGQLRAYKKYAGQPRMLQQLVKAAGQLQGIGLNAEQVAAAAQETIGKLQDKLQDLAVIMAAYDAARAGSRLDPSEMLALLAEKIGGVTEPGQVYYIDGFMDFSVPQTEVLRALLNAGADITVCLTCDEGGGGIFAVPQQTVRRLQELAASCGVPFERQHLEARADTPIRFFCDGLFDFTGRTMPDPDGTVRLTEADDVFSECELAASYMAELARQGVRWREMAVAVRGFDDYRAVLESMCERYGVPMFLAGRGDMLRRSVPLMIASVLEAAARGFEYEPVFSWLKTGLSPLTPEECDLLENYVLRWDIRRGRWEHPFIGHPDGYNRTATDESNAKLERLNELRERVAVPLVHLRQTSSAAETALQHVTALTDFFIEIELPQRLQDRADALEAAGRPETAAEYQRVWEVVCTALEQFAGVLADMPMDTAYFRDLLCLMLSCYDVSIIPVSLDRVQAGDMSNMRRRHVKHLLVLGASDARLPAPDDGSGVFTQEERAELNEKGLRVGTVEEDYARELGNIYTCLSLPSDGLYISWPRADGDGERQQPSIVAERACVLLGTQKARGDVLRARTFSPQAAFSLAVRAEAGGTELPCLQADSWFREQGRQPEVRRVLEAALVDRGRLSRAAVTLLYGHKPSISATRADKFADCRYSYFLQYGLKAQPREQSVFDPRDFGTFVHLVLEGVAQRALDAGGFSAVDSAQVRAWTNEIIDDYIRTELHDFAGQTERFKYLFLRNRTELHHITQDTWQELRQSKFVPCMLEGDLKKNGLDSLEEGISLVGRPDRVDAWTDGDRKYIRVVDYKTGTRTFALSHVCEGKDLQMLLYLFALLKNAGNIADHDGQQVLPAGVLYSHAKRQFVSADYALNDAELRAEQGKQTLRDGLVLDDGDVQRAMDPSDKPRYLPKLQVKGKAKNQASFQQFEALDKYVTGCMRRVGSEIAQGSIDAAPWREGQDTACDRCNYRHVCLFNEERDSYRERRNIPDEEAWRIIMGTEDEA